MSVGDFVPCRCAHCEPTNPAFAVSTPAPQSTIPLRIRVGVTADGTYAAASIPDHGTERLIRDELPGPVVAWHWITAEVPMPEVEHGETRGEVEP